MTPPKLAFIGFGEAASIIATDLLAAGMTDINVHALDPRRIDGITYCDDAMTACTGRDVVISAVTAAVALDVAKATAPHLTPEQIYLDINSVSPATKRAIADAITAAGAAFVEASVMGAVPKFRAGVPILLSGPKAGDTIAMLGPYGMNLRDLGPEYGRAAATKMFRSIMVKGLEALLQECVRGAERYGVADEVLASVGEGYPGIDWGELADHLIGRTAIHGIRRADEMDEVAATLRELGIEPFMAEAAAKRLRSLASPELKARFGDTAPDSFHEVLAALDTDR